MIRMTDKKATLLLGFVFFIFGVASLLPWNVFITAHEYFRFKLDDNLTHPNNHTSDSDNAVLFETYFSITGTITMLVGVLINMALTERISNTVRMGIGHILLLLGLIATTLLTKIDTSEFGSSFLQGSSLGLAAMLPPICMQMTILAQAVAGVVVSVLSILSQAATSEDVELSGLLYFAFAILIVVISFAAFIATTKPSFTGYANIGGSTAQVPQTTEQKGLLSSEDNPEESDDNVSSANKYASINDVSMHGKGSKAKLLSVIRKTFIYGLCPVITFFVTLACFPAIASRVVSSGSNPTWKKYFTAVACFLAYNVSDCIGRFCPFLFKWPKFGRHRQYHLLALCCLRVVFIPAFLLCNVVPAINVPRYFSEDYQYILIMIAFAWTNGYTLNLACSYLPKVVDASEEELAGSLLTVYCVVGICLGPLASIVLTKLLS